MKITKNQPKFVVPPATYTLVLDEREARMLRNVFGQTNCETLNAAIREGEKDITAFQASEFASDMYELFFKVAE